MSEPLRLSTTPGPTIRELYSTLGIRLSARKRNSEASQMFEQALKEEGESPDVFTLRFHLANAYHDSDRLRLAFHAYLEALLAAPGQIHTILPYAHALLTPEIAYAEGDWLENRWMRQIGWSELPSRDRADGMMFLGRVSLYRSQFANALKLFEDAVSANPADPYAQEGLGESLWRTGDLRQSAKALAEARELALAHDVPWRVKAIDAKLALVRSQSYLELGQPEKALEELNTAQQTDAAAGLAKADPVRLLLLRAQALTALKRYSEAVATADQILQTDSFSYDAIFCKAQALIEGQLDPAQGRPLLKLYSEQPGAPARIERLARDESSRPPDGHFQLFLAEVYYAFGRIDDALAAVNRALEIGFGEGVSPEAPAQRLKGELWEARGEAQNAAQSFYEAARGFYWRSDFSTGCELFERAAALNKGRASTYWYWSDCLRLRAYQLAPPSGDPKIFSDALKIWNEGAAIALPNVEFSWAYLTRALLVEQTVISTSEDPERLWWEAIVFCERAILLDLDDPLRWTCLARYHRFLGNNTTSVQAAERSMELAPDSPQALDECTNALTAIAEFARALKLIDKRRAAEPNVFADGLKALILMYVREPLDPAAQDPVTSATPVAPGDYETALSLLEPAIKTYPDNIWFHHLRALCYFMLSRMPEATQEFEWIWQLYSPRDKGNLATFTSAAYLLGKLDETIELCEASLSADSDNAGAYYHLGLSYLAREDVARGEKNFTSAIDRARKGLLIDMFVFGFRSLEAFAPHWTRSSEVHAALDRIRGKARARYVEYVPPSSEDELQRILAKSHGSVPAGVYAGLARLYTAQQRWSEAIETYRRLQEASEFPEASAGLQIVLQKMTAQADLLSKNGKTAESAALLTQALALDLPLTPEQQQSRAGLYSRLGYVSLLESNWDGMRANFAGALALYRAMDASEPGGSLASACLPLMNDSSSYWKMDEELSCFESESSADPILQRDLRAARKRLANYLPPIPRLVLEIGKNLLPGKIWVTGMSMAELNKKWPLTGAYLPNMRSRIGKETGVEIPGVQVRDDLSLPADGYRIRIDEIPVGEGSIQSGRLYCPASVATLSRLGIEEKTIVTAPHPVTGELGCWIDPENRPLIASAGLELWESTDIYAVWHIEAIIRRNLADFIDVQDTENLLRAKKLLPGMAEPGPQIRLTRVLKALVSDQVPIIAFAEIVDAVRQSEDGDLASTVEAVKLRLGRGTAAPRSAA